MPESFAFPLILMNEEPLKNSGKIACRTPEPFLPL